VEEHFWQKYLVVRISIAAHQLVLGMDTPGRQNLRDFLFHFVRSASDESLPVIQLLLR